MEELIIEAKDENLDTVIDFVNEQLDRENCGIEIRTRIDIAVEEIFVNIAHYAYPSDHIGKAAIQVSFSGEPLQMRLTFIDEGARYDPLEHPDPDVDSLSLEKRRCGGMGIYIVKKSMDDMAYRYEDGKNILTISKYLDR